MMEQNYSKIVLKSTRHFYPLIFKSDAFKVLYLKGMYHKCFKHFKLCACFPYSFYAFISKTRQIKTFKTTSSKRNKEFM